VTKQWTVKWSYIANAVFRIVQSKRGFTIELKRLKPSAPDFGRPQNFGNKDNFQCFCKQLYR